MPIARFAKRHLGTVWAVLGLLAAGCGTRPPADDPAALAADTQPDSVPPVTGRWSLQRSPPPENAMSHIRLELEIDSAPGGTLFGRLASYLAGDVGIDPSVFPRFGGALTPEGTVTIRIGHADTLISGFVLRGRVGADTIPLDLFVIGPDTVSDGPWRWSLVRRR